MTPAQIDILALQHIKINDAKNGSNATSNNKNQTVNIDPADPNTPAVLAGLAKLKPRIGKPK